MKSNRKKESFNEAIVGVFMTVVILLLAYFTIVISGVDVLQGRSKVAMTVLFDQVGGLKDHDNVMYRGTKVGVIESVGVTPSNLVVRASIDRNVVLRDGCRISVCNLSMLGGNYLLLEEGVGGQVDLANTVFHGETPNDWMRDVAKIAENVRAITEMNEVRGIITNVEHVSAEAGVFMTKANRFADDLQGVVAEARSFIERATSAAARIDSAAEKVDQIAEGLNRAKMFDDLEAGIAAFRKAAEGFDMKATVDKANELLASLNGVVMRLERGEGTLGKLLANPEMYNEMNGLIKDARQVLDNYRDTTPISTFSSLATGAL